MIYRIKILQLYASLVIVHTHLKPEELQRFPMTFVRNAHRFTKLFSLLVMVSFDSWLNGIYSNLGDKPSMYLWRHFQRRLTAWPSAAPCFPRPAQIKRSEVKVVFPSEHAHSSALASAMGSVPVTSGVTQAFFKCQVEVSGHPALQTI